ncbi:MAG: 4Fe-4S binding protein [Chloroflexi bacterium]|nr:4Fe-4S binding protein [Chloroflexota bacterium]
MALLLFLYLLFETRQQLNTIIPHDLFFRLNPLAAISAMLASRSWMLPMALAGITLLLTIAVGRAWCGWLCPLGTLLDWIPSRRPNRKGLDISTYWRQGKNIVLFTILLAAAAGNLTLLFLDPITILFRTIASTAAPIANWAVTSAQEWLYQLAALRPALEWSDRLIRGALLSDQPFYLPGLLIALLFAGVLALNAIRPRFWCRYLCPLGALLGLVSRIGLVRQRVNQEQCTKCFRCAVECHTAAIKPERRFVADTAECTTCLDCMEICPAKAISFGGQRAPSLLPRYEPSRRQFLVSLGAAAAGTALLRIPSALGGAHASLVRPPGANEDQLASKCIRCGECARVCPTGVIQPSVADWEGVWTPRMVTRLGYCDYSCNACGQVCPTGAIAKLALADKQRAVIGIAVVDEKRCIPFAEGRECIVCEEVCPIPEKAIKLEEKAASDSLGRAVLVRQPRVVTDLCTGCGICDYQCPVSGKSAIPIYPTGESGVGYSATLTASEKGVKHRPSG